MLAMPDRRTKQVLGTEPGKSLALVRSSNQARCSPEMAFGLCPPICPGATLPVSRNRRTQTIAVLTPAPNCAAAWWQDRRGNHALAKIH
jgi:hypothetical protein